MTVKDNGDAALLKLLLQCGLCSDEVGTAACQALAVSPGVGLSEWLVRNNVTTEETLARTIAERLQLPYVNLAALSFDPTVTNLLKEDVANRYGVVPLRASEGSIVVAMANPLNRDAVRAIGFAVSRRVHVEVATRTLIQDTLEHMYHLDEALDAYLRGIPDGAELPVAELVDEPGNLKSLVRESELPPVIKLLNLIILEAIRSRASDVHIETSEIGVLVRYRIDGVLEESFRLPKWIQAPLIARCKVLAKLDITERRVPQDGRIRLNYRESMIDFRVSSLPTQFGEKITMRILDPKRTPHGLDQFGFSPHDLRCIRSAIKRPEGMIVVTGPTGSGKTTTLYGMLAEMISSERNIVTIENPIEYQIRGINQVEVNEKQGLTFAGTLRSILRQDPDVILVGEIRDLETAQIAVRAAQTGHLVLTSLHTNDAVSTIGRLLDLGIEPYLLASSLHVIIGQRLVRRICEQCAAPYEPEAADLRSLQIAGDDHHFRRGAGCAACHQSGLSGRAAVYEVLPVSTAIAKVIESKGSESALRSQARSTGMRSLAEQAATMVCAGITTAEEVLRVVDVLDAESRCVACGHAVEDSFVLCPHCATPLHAACKGCNARLEKQWEVCPYCGVAPPKQLQVTPPGAPLPAAAPMLAAQPPKFEVLVVDDQPDMRRLAVLTLQQSSLPITVSAVNSGMEAIARAEASPPGVILLDVMMPEMDGFEVCRRLRANVRTAFIPILMLTALNDTANRTRGFLAGTDDYIGKPFARNELIARVRRLLQRTYGACFQDIHPMETAGIVEPETKAA